METVGVRVSVVGWGTAVTKRRTRTGGLGHQWPCCVRHGTGAVQVGTVHTQRTPRPRRTRQCRPLPTTQPTQPTAQHSTAQQTTPPEDTADRPPHTAHDVVKALHASQAPPACHPPPVSSVPPHCPSNPSSPPSVLCTSTGYTATRVNDLLPRRTVGLGDGRHVAQPALHGLVLRRDPRDAPRRHLRVQRRVPMARRIATDVREVL